MFCPHSVDFHIKLPNGPSVHHTRPIATVCHWGEIKNMTEFVLTVPYLFRFSHNILCVLLFQNYVNICWKKTTCKWDRALYLTLAFLPSCHDCNLRAVCSSLLPAGCPSGLTVMSFMWMKGRGVCVCVCGWVCVCEWGGYKCFLALLKCPQTTNKSPPSSTRDALWCLTLHSQLLKVGQVKREPPPWGFNMRLHHVETTFGKFSQDRLKNLSCLCTLHHLTGSSLPPNK